MSESLSRRHESIEHESAGSRAHSVDTVTARTDVEEALPTTKPVDVAPDGGYGVSSDRLHRCGSRDGSKSLACQMFVSPHVAEVSDWILVAVANIVPCSGYVLYASSSCKYL